MAWTIEWDERALKEFEKLDKGVQKKIRKYLNERIAKPGSNPYAFGKGLAYDKVGLWRYRVEDYRIVCQIEDEQLIVLVIKVAHRKEVY
ncbi:MAG TPA: type II toxin-antitoxin system RelE/ParE family toxin [Gammaproteobacteria bacterium]|nr:type II toxin-antitoxin system RelE/ParE family toxin [Gammaproteobacteria bacterium]